MMTHTKRHSPLNTAIALILFVSAANTSLARNPGDPLKPGFNTYSKQQDIELGKEAAAQVKQQYQQVLDKNLQAYIRKVGARLAKTPSASNSGFTFSFTLLNYKEINAFALPGGPTFVFTGLIKASDNEGELAGVLSHEISHVVLRHGTNQLSKANIIRKPALVIGALNTLTMLGRLINLGLGVGLNGVFLKYSREDESEADALGTHIMSEAGYDPSQLAHFFDKLESEGGPGVPEFLSDHPSPENRVEAIKAEARTLSARTYTTDNREFERAQAAIAKLPAPPDFRPKDIGITNADVAGYKKLNTPQFSAEYPSGWHVLGDPDSPMLALAPDEGVVAGKSGDPAIGYGSMFGYFFADPDRASLGDATNDLVQRLRTEDPGIKGSWQQLPGEVDKRPASTTQLTSNSPMGGAERDMLVTVVRPEGLFYVIFITPESRWDEVHATFDHMLQSIRFAP
jgi:predicted Zn-dependent protease